jgi:hypothetical protein
MTPSNTRSTRPALSARPAGSCPMLCRFSPAECPDYETCPFLHRAVRCSGSCPFDVCSSCEAPKNYMWKKCGSKIACPTGDYCKTRGCRNLHRVDFYNRCMFTMKRTSKTCNNLEECTHLGERDKLLNREYRREVSLLAEYHSIRINDIFQKAPDLFGTWRSAGVRGRGRTTKPFGARTHCEVSSPG